MDDYQDDPDYDLDIFLSGVVTLTEEAEQMEAIESRELRGYLAKIAIYAIG
jgi:hypothetical protein